MRKDTVDVANRPRGAIQVVRAVAPWPVANWSMVIPARSCLPPYRGSKAREPPTDHRCPSIYKK